MKKLSLFLTVFLLLSYSGYAQWKVNTVPDPKTTGLGFISNPDNILLDKEVAYLDSIIQEVQDSSKAQIAIVMLQSIGDEVPKTFATELFNLWGVGNAETDNGLLILFVMDQRRIEFETGYGTEQILSDAKSYEIQQEFMVPRFKEGNYGKGIVEGTEEIVRIFMGRAEERALERTLCPVDRFFLTSTFTVNVDRACKIAEFIVLPMSRNWLFTKAVTSGASPRIVFFSRFSGNTTRP